MTVLASLLIVLLAGATAQAAAATGSPTIVGVPDVGLQLTATPVDPTNDSIDWETCDEGGAATAPGEYLATNTTTYTLATNDRGTYVCAVEATSAPLLGTLQTSAPSGPVGTGPTLSSSDPLQQNDPLTLTSGDYKTADTWFDCDSSGANCEPFASQPTGSPYTVSRADADHTIEVQETETYQGATATQTTPPTGLVTASAPSILSAPTVSGTAQVGQTLTASPGSWSNDPTVYQYAWVRCSAGACSAIPNASDKSYVAGTADIGSVLEVFVTASVYSSQGSPFPSYPTNAVVAATTGTGIASSGGTTSPVARSRTSKKVLGHLASTMRWTFRYTPSYTQIIAFAVQHAAVGSTVTVRCSGKGCPFTKRGEKITRATPCGSTSEASCRRAQAVDLKASFRGRDLRIGDTVTVSITRHRYVGKYYRFTVRRGKQPAVKISCLAPGSDKPGKACTTS